MILLLIALAAGCAPGPATRVGSKADSESVVLGEAAALLLREGGADVTHRRELGGTAVLWQALTAGEIDLYPEFTGTLVFSTLHDPALTDLDRLEARLESLGLGTTRPLGYQNNYAIGVRAEDAKRLNLTRLSDLVSHPELRLGLTNEFTRRADGWPALARHYGLTGRPVLPLEHKLAYDALARGDIDATDVYTTDAEIAQGNLALLPDDREFLPKYRAIFLYSLDWARRNPDRLADLKRLEGALTEPMIRAANGKTLGREPESRTAAWLLNQSLGIDAKGTEVSRRELLLGHLLDHLLLVAVSLTAAIVVAVPLGVASARRPVLGQVVVGVCGLIQTVPSLALIVMLVAVPVIGGLGPRPAMIALFLYSLLPIVRNTATGLTDIPPALRESAEGLGLSRWAVLRRVELPLASRPILAGVKTAAVINVGTATLGALVGAGGLGVPIQQGLRTSDTDWILAGAVPAALLAVAVQLAFELAERRLVPRGLRLPQAR